MNFKQLIQQNYHFLLKRLDPSHEFFGGLQRNEAVQHKIASIEEQPTPTKKVDALLNALLDVRDGLQNSLMDDVIEALRSSGQGHIANIFRKVSDEVSMSDEHCYQLQTKASELIKYMDTENGLLNELFSAKVVGCSEVELIRSESGRNDMARRLIEILMKKTDYAFETLVKKLNEVGQTHVAYILTGEGSARPLSERLRDKLISARVKLIGSIYFKGLVSALMSRHVFTDFDQQHVESRPTENEKIERTLDLIARKSQSAFDEFLVALHETHNEHVVVEMMGSEIAAKVELKLDTNEAGFCTANSEKELRETIQNAFEKDEEGVRYLNEVLDESETCFTGVEDGSIIVKFRCKNIAALQKLHRSNKLNDLFTKTFCRAPGQSISLQIEERQFQQCADNFTALKLMTPEHREGLLSSAKFLVGNMKVSDDLLDRLTLCRERRQTIEAAATHEDQVKTLLDVVSRQPDSAFKQFLDALRDAGQEQCALIIGALAVDHRDEETIPQQPKTAQTMAEDLLRRLISNLHTIDNETITAISNLRTSLRRNMGSTAVERTQNKETNVAGPHHIETSENCNSLKITEMAENDRITAKQLMPLPNSVRTSSQGNQALVTDNRSCMIDIVPSTERVYGVTSLQGKLFVLRADWIDVYTTTSDYSILDPIHLAGLKGHEWNDLTSSVLHKSLYASDCTKQRILVVELGGSVREWMVQDWPCGVSVTPDDDTLLVTCAHSRELRELSLDHGDWLRCVKLCSDIQQPLHAFKLTTGHYVVSHSSVRRLPGQHRVCMVDSAGSVLYSYGAQSGSAVGQLDLPCHLGTDKGDFVFVADSSNNRIVLLNPAIQLVQHYVGSVSHPRRLHLERGTRRLYVGESGNRVMVVHLNDSPLYCQRVRLLAIQHTPNQCIASA